MRSTKTQLSLWANTQAAASTNLLTTVSDSQSPSHPLLVTQERLSDSSAQATIPVVYKKPVAIWETGASSHTVNDLVLFSETSRSCQEMITSLYTQTPASELPFVIEGTFLPDVLRLYNKEIGEVIGGEIRQDHIADFVALYANDYYEYFLLENKDVVPPTVPDGVTSILNKCSIEGLLVKLPPGQLERDLYQVVKQKLELIGGKWKGGKIQGFLFPEDPSPFLAQIVAGVQRNLKKEYQFFPTPPALADRLVSLAGIEIYHSILEPEAGEGALIDAICRAFPMRATYDRVHCFEIKPSNIAYLQNKPNALWMGEDFLQINPDLHYDRILANPPFAKNQDITHIYKMYEVLKPGGRLVTIASIHWQHSANKKEIAFRDWLSEMKAQVLPLPKGTFKEAGTNFPACIIILSKNS